MDGTDCNTDCNKRTKIKCGSGFRVDRISELPDEITYIILSFLPLRQAAATSLLSRRWQHSWKHTSNLDFCDPHAFFTNTKSWRANKCHRVQMVNSVLESHQALFIKQFKFSIYVHKSAHATITKWLEFAQSRQVERLDLNFHNMIKTERSGIVLEDLVREMRPMKYLKALSLAAMKVSGQDISYFLKSCPMLRELNITQSSFTSDVHVSGNLEILRIRGCTFRKFVVEISAPLLYEIVADLYEVYFKAKPGALRFKNVPRLAIASLEIANLRYNAANTVVASTVSCFTSHLQKLILFIPYSKLKILLREGLPYMPNLKELYVVVSRIHAHRCLVPVTSIILACPQLQMFTFQFYVNETDERCPDNYECKQIYIYEPSRFYGCPHKRLKMLKFHGSCATDIVKLMTYISGCCVEYQKINTCSLHMSETQVQAHMRHIQQLLSRLPRQVEFKGFY